MAFDAGERCGGFGFGAVIGIVAVILLFAILILITLGVIF